MKIVEIIPELASGGAERFVVDLSNELSTNNEVFLISFFDNDIMNFYSKELYSSVKHIILKKNFGFSIKMFVNLYRTLKDINPDVIHLHLGAFLYTIPFLLLNRRIKYFITIHNDAYKDASSFGRFLRRIFFKLGLISPIAISNESLRSFEECYGSRAAVIFNGRKMPDVLNISTTVFEEFQLYRKNDNTRVLINLARFSLVKRQPLIAKCVKRLYEEGFDFSFLMIGQNRQEEILSEVEKYKCPALFILGEKHNPLEYLKMADAFCLFSVHEGMPISLIEALATGTVPVCTPVGGIVDVVDDHVNGLLTKNLSEEEIYNTMKEFIKMPSSTLESMKNKALESFVNYSIENTAKQHIDLFTK